MFNTSALIRVLAGLGMLTAIVCKDDSPDVVGPPPPPPPPTTELKLNGNHLVYVDSYLATPIRGGAAHEYLKVGWYSFKSNGVARIEYFWYDPSRNLRSWLTDYYHNAMEGCPYRENCQPGFIRIPAYAGFKAFDGTWEFAADTLRVSLGEVTHIWLLDDCEAKAFVLDRYVATATGLPVIGDDELSHFIGFGFVSGLARTTTQITWDRLLDDYEGQLVQNRSFAPTDQWVEDGTSLSVDRFGRGNNTNVRGYPRDCNDDERCGTDPMWCNTSILLNFAPTSKLFIYMNGGHDFHCDGCYGSRAVAGVEPGHTWQMMGATDPDCADCPIDRLVALEHSYDDEGYPIISLCRYFDPRYALR